MESSRDAIWLTLEDIQNLSKSIADKLDTPDLDPESRQVLRELAKEMGVARTRYETGPIPAHKLRAALGKPEDSIPVRMSRKEALILLQVLDLPIAVKDKVLSSI